jgi:hypothetical protein
MSDPTFTEGQRVRHRNLDKTGAYRGRDDLDRATSHVEFDDGDELRVSTSSLEPLDEENNR